MLTFGHHDLNQAEHILLPQALQQFDLPHGRHWEPILFTLHPYPFERDKLARLDIARLVDLTVGALANASEALVRLTWLCRL